MKAVNSLEKINCDNIILFHSIFEDEIISAAVRLMEKIADGKDWTCLERDYFFVQRLLLKKEVRKKYTATYWQNYIADLVAECENKFSLQCEKENSPERLYFDIAVREINLIKKLYCYDWKHIASCFNDNETSLLCVREECIDESRKQIHQALSSDGDRESAAALACFYAQNGCGIFEKFNAFIWKSGLAGISDYDAVRFEDLTGYEIQKKVLIENTRFFIDGFKANNVLLYGDKGTGKSSSVKALLSKFASNKLKMIELSRENFAELNIIMDTVRDRGFKFIIFIDDLSFEEFETGYKYLKSIIEGGLEKQPDNILIYVTSNRRNIIRETWENQNGLGTDIHTGDSVQERLSLADRFGITITFPSPDKTLFLRIVKDMAHKENLDISEEELYAEALKWEMRYHGRSGRTARQFINDLKAKRTNIEK